MTFNYKGGVYTAAAYNYKSKGNTTIYMLDTGAGITTTNVVDVATLLNRDVADVLNELNRAYIKTIYDISGNPIRTSPCRLLGVHLGGTVLQCLYTLTALDLNMDTNLIGRDLVRSCKYIGFDANGAIVLDKLNQSDYDTLFLEKCDCSLSDITTLYCLNDKAPLTASLIEQSLESPICIQWKASNGLSDEKYRGVVSGIITRCQIKSLEALELIIKEEVPC